MDDIDRVLKAARRYGVACFLLEDFPLGFGEHEPAGKNPRGLMATRVSEEATPGPLGHFCDAANRRVWFQHFDPKEVETHLHEVCHCIINPPGGINQLSEDVLLMPFERTLARQILSPASYKRVINWQESGTEIEWWDARREKFLHSLEYVPNYTRWALWRESFKALRRMGAIKNGRVTWQRPNWVRAPKYIMERGNF